jgi:hypothetical protein
MVFFQGKEGGSGCDILPLHFEAGLELTLAIRLEGKYQACGPIQLCSGTLDDVGAGNHQPILGEDKAGAGDVPTSVKNTDIGLFQI